MNASDPNTKLKAETVAMLRAVLISSPLGVPFEKLNRDYKQLTGKTIPYKELGFKKLENFIQSIPDVARAEQGPNGEWTIKGVASDADKHVAKLISKQKKPKVRKSAKLIKAKKPSKLDAPPGKFNTPVKQTRKAPVRKFVPPRMQTQQKGQGERITSTAAAGVTDLRQKLKVNKEVTSRKSHVSRKLSDGNSSGTGVKKGTDNVMASKIGQSTSLKTVSPVFQKVAVNIFNTSSGRSVRSVTTGSSAEPCSPDILENSSIIKWIKDELEKFPNGLWATRLAVLFEENFKKTLTVDAINKLRFRPDIVKMEQPIEGRFLLYSSVEQDTHVQPVQDVSAAKHEESPPCGREDVVLPHELLDVGSTYMVYITHIENVGCFYITKTDAIIISLNEEIQKQYKETKYSSDDIPSIKPGQILCAQYTEDQSFYRACVNEIVNSKHVRVLYVDFGNQEIVEVERLRALRKEFQSQPVQAVQCCLHGIEPPNEGEDWNEESLLKFQELVIDKELRVTVKDREDKILSVSLYDESSQFDVGDGLIKAGVASPLRNLSSTPSSSSSSLSSSTGASSENTTPSKKDGIPRSRRTKSKLPGVVELPEERFIDVYVCSITGTYDIYLRLIGDEYSKKFEMMEESMSLYYSDSKAEVTTEPAPGDLFALMSDGVWCRVKVRNVKGSIINVFFVDYGDTAETTVADLRALAFQFQQLPLQAFQCALNGLPKTRNPDVVGKLTKLALGEVCVAEVFKRSADLVFVELIETASAAQIVINDVVRKLVIPDEELKPVLPKVGETTEVGVPYISPSGSVFLHILGAGTKRLEELNKDLTDFYSSKQVKASEFVSNPTAGKVCCAKSEDGHWYRVKIISAADRHAVEVLYVDFGNTDTVAGTNLREPTQANDHVLSLPFQALECQLYDIPKNDWSEDLAKEMMDIIAQGVITAEVVSLCEGELPSVSLLVTVKAKEDEEITEPLTRLVGIPFDEEIIKDAVESEEIGDDRTLSSGNEIIVGEMKKNIVREEEKNTVGESKKIIDGDSRNVRADKGEENSVDERVNGDTVVKSVVDEREKNTVQQVGVVVNDVQDVQATEGGTLDVDDSPINKVVHEPSPWKELPLINGWMDVLITEVKDPEHFTFQLLPNLEKFYDMSDRLNEHYKNASPADETPVEGVAYAAFHEEHDCWYRAVVESVFKDKVYVLFVDYGDTATIDSENIQLLQDDFLELPCQGVQGSLTGIKVRSKSSKTKWSKECIKHFKYLTSGHQLVAKVTSGHTSYRPNQTSRVFVELYDTSDPSKDISIAQELIKLELAETMPS